MLICFRQRRIQASSPQEALCNNEDVWESMCEWRQEENYRLITLRCNCSAASGCTVFGQQRRVSADCRHMRKHYNKKGTFNWHAVWTFVWPCSICDGTFSLNHMPCASYFYLLIRTSHIDLTGLISKETSRFGSSGENPPWQSGCCEDEKWIPFFDSRERNSPARQMQKCINKPNGEKERGKDNGINKGIECLWKGGIAKWCRTWRCQTWIAPANVTHYSVWQLSDIFTTAWGEVLAVISSYSEGYGTEKKKISPCFFLQSLKQSWLVNKILL